jgi:hypothetical protein
MQHLFVQEPPSTLPTAVYIPYAMVFFIQSHSLGKLSKIKREPAACQLQLLPQQRHARTAVLLQGGKLYLSQAFPPAAGPASAKVHPVVLPQLGQCYPLPLGTALPLGPVPCTLSRYPRSSLSTLSPQLSTPAPG